jgi:hypothetical protein
VQRPSCPQTLPYVPDTTGTACCVTMCTHHVSCTFNKMCLNMPSDTPQAVCPANPVMNPSQSSHPFVAGPWATYHTATAAFAFLMH